MNALHDAMGLAALGWVKPELDETLRLARDEIQYFIEDPADTARMHLCAGYLHQVQGSLRMVELYAPALVADELDGLAQDLRDGKVQDHDEACITLMRGTVLLPDYLERLQAGHRDIPIVLLPLLNDVRGLRGEPLLAEGDLASDPILRSTFRLDDPVPDAEELEHARASVSGHNRALLDTVGSAVKEELMRVKDALDLHLRTGGEASELQPQVAALSNVGETLGMLGLGEARRIILEQCKVLGRLTVAAGPADEVRLLDIAGALLYVDATIDNQSRSLGEQPGGASVSANAGFGIAALAQEAIANFASAREGFVAFIETSWNHDELVRVPGLLSEVAGALRMLDLEVAADYIEGVRRFVRNELIARRRIPASAQLDTLADAMASLEYYLEALRDQRPNPQDILDIARRSLALLGYWPLPEELPAKEPLVMPASGISRDSGRLPPMPSQAAPAPTVPQDDEPSPFADFDASRLGLDEFIAAQSEAVPAWQPEPVAAPAADTIAPDLAVVAPASVIPAEQGGFTRSEEIDDEIREVFLEELDEEIANLGVLFPAWRAAQDDLEKLRPIRRVFHTLKGSGRLVGATLLGEFAWKVENMLNRVLDGSRPASASLVALLGQAVEILPLLSAALHGHAPVKLDIDGFKGVADRLAAGEEASYTPVRLEPAVVEALPEPQGVALDAGFEGPAEGLAPESAGVLPAALPAVQEAEPEGTPASVDEMLKAILQAEVGGYLETVRAWLAEASAAPQPVSSELLRALHTMNGALGMAEVPEITAVTSPAEQYLKRVLSMRVLVPAIGVDALGAVADAVQLTLERLELPSQRIPSFAVLAARLTDMVEALPAPMEPIIPQPVASWEQDTEADELELAADDEAAESEAAAPALAFASDSDGAPVADKGEAEPDTELPVPGQDYRLEDVLPVPDPASLPSASSLSSHLMESSLDGSVAHEPAALPAVDGVPPATDPALLAEEVDALPTEAVTEDMPPALESPDSAGLHFTPFVSTSPTAVLQVDLDIPLPSWVKQDVPAVAASPVASVPANILDLGPLSIDAMEMDLVDIFVEEGRDLLDHADGLLAQLRQLPEERLFIIELQRDLHTLKGGARMAGINNIGDLAHGIESLMEQVVGQRLPLGLEGVRALERGFDALNVMLGMTGAHRRVSRPDVLIAEFEARASGRPLPAIAEPESAAQALVAVQVEAAEEAVEPKSQPAVGTQAGIVEEVERSNLLSDAMQPDAPSWEAGPSNAMSVKSISPEITTAVAMPESASQAGAEQLRIRADLLDRLVNHAGEVAIYRARLEQQLNAFRGVMTELDRTNVRMRDQLRRLDLETEAQIVARYQREHDARDATFDPLEMDRFSTLQQLSRALTESAADIQGLQSTLEDFSRHYDSLLQQQARVSSDMQEDLMNARMVPFDGVIPRLRRVVRQAAQDADKLARLEVDGMHAELDRGVLERVTAPLEHLLRNAVAHGLENPDQRRRIGKNQEGLVRVRVRREGSEMVLQVIDDGSGLDHAAIQRRAVERGLLAADAQPAPGQLERMILESGFSTVEGVSQLAGRGVGMDVVNSEVRQLGGTLEIASAAGQGATFTLRLPQTMAVSQAVFVRVGESTQFAVPVASVSGIGRISHARFASGGSYVYDGQEYPLHDLGVMTGHAPVLAEGQAYVPLLLINSGDLRAAVAVDEVAGNQEIVVKPVGPQLTSIPGIHGATITGDGGVVVVLDTAPLVRRFMAQPRLASATATDEQHVRQRVMVVDDSLTMRKVSARVLERNGFDVVTARDGVEALELLEEGVPTLMLLDIEMPRMDGYELAATMRADPRFRDVPIIMITSRTGDKHRQRAMEIGVQRYMGKPYQEHDLMRNVHELLGADRGRD